MVPALSLREVALSDAAKKQLHDRLSPYLGMAQPTAAQLEESGSLIRSTFPSDFFPALEGLLSQQSIAPLLVHNLPEITYDRALETKIDALGPDAAPVLTFGYWIAQGIYGASTATMGKSRLLLRETGAAPKPRLFHRDIHPFTALSFLRNSAGLPTLFLDMRQVLAELSPAEKKAIHLQAVWDMPAMTLAEYEGHFSSTPALHLRHGILLSSPDAHFEALVDKHALPVTVMPGSMLVWHNSIIYHRAPVISAPDDNKGFKYSRAAMYTAATL